MSNNDTEATPTQKAAEIAWKLQQGQEFTTAQVAEQYGMTYCGANRLMNTISGRLPIVRDGGNGVWKAGVWKKIDN